jgi:putative phosphoesterase
MINIIESDPENIRIETDQSLVRFAVIADTHVPDRVDGLHPKLLPLLESTGIDVILHCGDVIDNTIVDQFSKIKPVLTVLGNRDAFFSKATHPFKRLIKVYEKKIGMYHGFLSIKHYFPDKLQYIVQGYFFEKYYQIGQELFPTADILCFGHTHTAEIRRYNKQLVINPGTAGPRSMNGGSSFAILNINQAGIMKAHFIPLQGYENRKGSWVKCE